MDRGWADWAGSHFDFIFFLLRPKFSFWWDGLTYCDSDLKVVTYYDNENDDSDRCDCVGSNHLSFHLIRIAVTYENSPTPPPPQKKKIPSFIMKMASMKMTNNTLEIFPESHLGLVTTLLISNYQVNDTICQSLSPPPPPTLSGPAICIVC